MFSSWVILVVAFAEAHLIPEAVAFPAPSAGCGKAVTLRRGNWTRQTVTANERREYLVTIPSDYDENRSYPLLLSPKLKGSISNLTPIFQPNEQTLEGSFSPVSTPNFASKYSLESS